MMKQFTTRKGITPVVAIVLLLMMTVAAAGGAFAWMNGIIGQTQEDVTQQSRTELKVMDVQCTGTNNIEWTIRNSGEVEVDGNQVDIFVYNVSNGALQDVDTVDGAAPGDGDQQMSELGASDNQFGPGELWRTGSANTIAGDSSNVNFQSGNSYRVVWEFTNSDAKTESVCQAE